MNNEQLRITHYNFPLFINCFKAYHPSQTNCSSYLILQYQQDESQLQIYRTLQSKFICPVIGNEDKQITLILMEGECFHKFILSRRNTLNDPILSQQQIWILIASLSSAFMLLRQNGLEDKLTHLREYCIRKVGIIPRYKLIFHSSMISQLKAAQQGLCRWDDLYLSPQELKQKFVPEKSIVFSLGVMLLNICSNCDRDRSIYKLNTYEVDHERISYKLSLGQNKYGYSKVLCNFVQKCLKINHQQRFDFSQLWNCLNDLIKRKNIKCWSIINELLYKKSKENSDTEHIKKPELEINKNLNLYKMIIKTKEKVTKPATEKPHLQKKYIDTQSSEEQQQFNKKIMRLGNEYNNSFHDSQEKQENQFLEPKQQDINFSEQEPLPRSQQVKMISDYRGTFGGNRNNSIQSEQSQQSKHNMIKIMKIRNNQSLLNQHKSIEDAANQPKKGHLAQTERVLIKKQVFDSNMIKNNAYQRSETKNNEQKPAHKIEQKQKQQERKAKHKYAIPQLIKSLNYLKLQHCLKPIEQIIKNFTSIGIWIEGDVYYGDYSRGTKNGLSLQLYANGEYYYGFFKEDLYHGEGFYFWNQSQYYLGHFNLGHKVWGRLEGEIRYQGSFKGNKRHGQGTCWYSTGEVYSGNWENGKRDGQGFIMQPSGTIFSGHWVRGNRRGEGYLQMDKLRIGGFWNGQTVEGESLIQYENGDFFRGKIGSQLQKLNGQYFSKSGTIFKGDFESDEPSEGLLQYSNGDKYYGQLRKMKRHGYGEYYYANGQVYKGNWQNNQKVGGQF